MKKEEYTILEKEKIIICKDSFNCYYLCFYKDGFKMEDKLIIPSAIQYSEDIYNFKSRDKFDCFAKYNIEDYTKIYLVKNVKKDIFIHMSGKNKTLVFPEDTINGVHIIKKKELKKYLENKDCFLEYNKYEI